MLKGFSLGLEEITLIYSKSNESRIGFSVLYLFLKNYGRFPSSKEEISEKIINHISKHFKTT